MDFHTMKRKDLQALCKKHSIPANLTNLEMANRLASLLKVDKEKPNEKRVKSCLKSLDEVVVIDEGNSEGKEAKKVRFSPQNETFEFEKTNPRALRMAARTRKSMVIVEDKVNKGTEVSQHKATENVSVDNQVRSTRTRGRGRKTEQVEVVDTESLPKKKEEDNNVSKRPSRKRTSIVVNHDGQSKSLKNTACEDKPVTRRSARIVEKPDDSSSSLTEQAGIVKSPKKKARSDCPVNQDVAKPSTRCSRRNTVKSESEKVVEEAKTRVTRNKQASSLNEGKEIVKSPKRKAGSDCAVSQDVEQAPTRCLRKTTTKLASEKAVEDVKGQGNEKAKVTRNIRQKKGDVGMKEAVVVTESVSVVEQCEQRRSTRNANKRVSIAPVAVNVKKSDNNVQERGIPLKNKQAKSRTKKDASTKEPENEVLSSKEKCIVIELSSSEGETTKGDGKASNTEKEEEFKEDYHNVDSSEDAHIVSNVKPFKTTSTVSRSVSEDDKTELENTVLKVEDRVQCDAPLTSTSTEQVTELSLPVCEAEVQGIYQTQLEIASPSSLIVDCETHNVEEWSLINGTESEDRTLSAKNILGNEQAQLTSTSGGVASVTEKENQSGDATFVSMEEGTIIDLGNLGGHISRDEGFADLKSDSILNESQSTLHKPVEATEMNTMVSNDPADPEADKCMDHLSAVHEAGKNAGHIQETEPDSPAETVDERSEGIDSHVSDGSDDHPECERNHKQGLATFNEETDGLAAEWDNVVISNELEDRIIAEVQLIDNQEDTVLTDTNLEVHEEKVDNSKGHIQEVEETPAEMIVERLEETSISVRSDDTVECERSHCQGRVEVHSQFTTQEETYDIGSLFQLEHAEEDRNVTETELERMTEVSDTVLNDNHDDDALLADQNLEVHEELGESVREKLEVSGTQDDETFTAGVAVSAGLCATSTPHKPACSDMEGSSSVKVQNATPYPSHNSNSNMESVAEFMKLGELTYSVCKDKLTPEQSALASDEEAFADKAGESDHQKLTELSTEVKMLTLQQITAEPISVQHRGYTETNSRISFKDEAMEGKDAITPYFRLLFPCQAEHAVTNITTTQEDVNGEVPRQDNVASASEGTQDGVTPNSYPLERQPDDVSFSTDCEEDGGSNAQNKAAPNALEGSMDEAYASDEIAKCVDSIATVEQTDLEKDCIGLEFVERTTKVFEPQSSDETLSVTQVPELPSPVAEGADGKNCSPNPEVEEANGEVFSLTPKPDAVELKDSSLKEAEGLTPMQEVKERLEDAGVESFSSGKLAASAGSEGSHKQGLTEEINLQLTGHEENTQRPVLVQENSESKDYEFTSYETALFMDDDHVGDQAGTHDWTSWENLLTSDTSGCKGKQEKDGMEQVAANEIQGCDSSQLTLLNSVVCDKDDLTDLKEDVTTDEFPEAIQAKHEGLIHTEHCITFEEVHDLMKEDDVDNEVIESPLTASFPESRPIIPGDGYEDADVKGISNGDLNEGSVERDTSSNVEAKSTAEDLDCLVEEVDPTKHICAEQNADAHEIKEKKECELARQETDDDTVIDTLDYYHMTSVACLPTNGEDAKEDMEEGIMNIDQVGDEPDQADVSLSMDWEEYESKAKENKAAPIVLQDSEEKLVILSSAQEADTSADDTKCDDGITAPELIAPSPEVLRPAEVLYSSEQTESNEDFTELAISESITDQTEQQSYGEKFSCVPSLEGADGKNIFLAPELEGAVGRNLSLSPELEEADVENASLSPEPEGADGNNFTHRSEPADKKEYKEDEILNAFSSEDSENMLLCSGAFKETPLKEEKGFIPMGKVNEGAGVESVRSERIDDSAGSDGNNKQGLTNESGLWLTGPVLLQENSESVDIELTSYETALFMGDGAGRPDSHTSDTNLLTSYIDGSKSKKEQIDLEQVAVDEVCKQGCDVSELTLFYSEVRDEKMSEHQNETVLAEDFFVPCKAFEEVSVNVDPVLEDEHTSIDQAKKDVAVNSIKEDGEFPDSMHEFAFTAETLEDSNEKIEEAPLTAPVPEIRSAIPDDECEIEDARVDLSIEDVFEGSKEEFLVSSFVEAHPTAENMESAAEDVEEMDPTKQTLAVCAVKDADMHENGENKEFESLRQEMDYETSQMEAVDLNQMTTDTDLSNTEQYATDMEVENVEEVADEQIKQDSGFTDLNSAGTLEVDHEDTTTSDICHEHSRTSFVTGIYDHLEDGNYSVNQPLQDLNEDESENIKGIYKETEIMHELDDKMVDASFDKVENSSMKPNSVMNQKKRSILIHGTPRRPIMTADMKENSTVNVKREHLADATAFRPVARRKALGELHKR